jgi:hypothetical protein
MSKQTNGGANPTKDAPQSKNFLKSRFITSPSGLAIQAQGSDHCAPFLSWLDCIIIQASLQAVVFRSGH